MNSEQFKTVSCGSDASGELPGAWMLDPEVTFLNHGSFGSCPRAVLEFQRAIRDRMERQPVRFFVQDLEGLLDEARGHLADFLGAPPNDLVFVQNATSGVNAVLRSLPFAPQDEILVTDHEYNACHNALDYAANRCGARVIVAKIPFPLQSESEIIEPVLSCVTHKTKLALLDHVTSQTGLVFPILRLIRELNERGVDTLIDGAHAPGMVPLNLESLEAAYYTGNCHKWLCAPKGAGFLYVRPDRQDRIRPTVISHGANSHRTDRSRFLIEFGWTGTCDPSAWLSVPEALRVLQKFSPRGLDAIRKHNRTLALRARKRLCETLSIPIPSPDEMIGALAAIPIPDSQATEPQKSPLYADPLQDELRDRYRIEVPVIPWPAPPKRLLRISAQLYNTEAQYDSLAAALKTLL